VNPIVERYEQGAADYARYWAPVLEATSRRVLEFVDAAVVRRGGSARVLEVGVGTGTLLLAALARWPRAEVIATDAAAGMLEAARTRVAAEAPDDMGRIEFIHAAAHELPLPDGSVDLVVSSFVLQLVPDRHDALLDALRVIRPGGTVGYVTWLDRDAREPFRPAEEFDEAVYDLEIDEPEEPDEPRAGDVRSARVAADELRRAGFSRASAREDELVYDWTMDSYLEYKLEFDELTLLSCLNGKQRGQLARNARDRLSQLSPLDFRWHAPVVFARAIKPAR
jgi:SAM-dependent methyltransferase